MSRLSNISVALLISLSTLWLCTVATKSTHTDDREIKYAAENSLRLSSIQLALQKATINHPWASMLGAPESIQLNSNLIKAIGGKRVLDIGTYTGYSALSAALAIPVDGEVHTMDIKEEFVNIGRPFFEQAKVTEKIKVHIAPALETLDKFVNEGQAGSFDFAFIDADKGNYINYYEKCLVLIRRGGIIAVDNTIWSGRVLSDTNISPSTAAIKAFNAHVKSDQRVDISFLTIGDGLTLLFVK